MVCTSTVVDDAGVGLTFGTNTPLFQISLLPDLTQVYFLPELIEVEPCLVHLAPALAAELAGKLTKLTANKTVKNRATLRMNRC